MNLLKRGIKRSIGIFAIVYLVTFCVYYSFTTGLDSSDLLLQIRRYVPSSLAVVLAITLWQKIGLPLKPLRLYLCVGLVWMVTYPFTYWIAFHKNTLYINYYFDVAFASYAVAALIILHVLLFYLGNSKVRSIVPWIAGLWQGLLLVLPISEWAYFYIYGTPITESTWVAILQTNLRESKEFIGQSTVVNGVGGGLICILLVFIVLIYLNYRWLKNTNNLMNISKKTLTLFFILMLVVGGYAGRAFMDTGVMKSYVLAKRYYKATEAFSKYHDINVASMSVAPSNPQFLRPSTIILVIGESGTRQYLSAYNSTKNDTSPWLREAVITHPKNFLLFRHAYTSWTQTVPALERALTEKNQYNTKEFNQSTTVIDLAKKAGYTTYWLSNQGTISDVDTPITLIAKTADHSVWLEDMRKDSDKIYYDGDLLPLLEEVDPTKNNFIVIHIIGSHEAAKNRFPDSFTKFGKKDTNNLETNYDNSIAYTDYVLQRIYEYSTSHLNLQAMVYFSDHGNAPGIGRNPDNGQFDSTRIPMFVYVSDEYRGMYPNVVATLTDHENSYFTNDLMYELIGGLLNIKSNRLDMSNSLASPTYKYTRDTLTTFLGRNKLSEDVHENDI